MQCSPLKGNVLILEQFSAVNMKHMVVWGLGHFSVGAKFGMD